MNPVTAGLLGAGLGLGLFLTWLGAHGHRALPRRTGGRATSPGSQRTLVRTAVAAGAAIAVLAVTGWVIGAVVAAVITLLLPKLMGRSDPRDGVTRTEALASWAQMLRDTLTAAGGLEQALAASAPIAPDAIAPQVRRLAIRAGRQPLPDALRAFADELADPLADKIAVALSAAVAGGSDIAALLSRLADSAQEEARMLLRVEVSRTTVRTSVRIISGVILTFAAGLVLLNRTYLSPYDTLVGQLVLLLVGGMFLAGLWLLAQLAATRAPDRLFTRGLGAEGER